MNNRVNNIYKNKAGYWLIGLLLISLFCGAFFLRVFIAKDKCPNDVSREYAIMQLGTAILSYQSDNGDLPQSISDDLCPKYLLLDNGVFVNINLDNVDDIYVLNDSGVEIVSEREGTQQRCIDWGRYSFTRDGRVKVN